MPRKEFEAFTRLDASDVNTFLMDQSVMSFGSAIARDAAIDTPVEGQVTYLTDIDSLTVYNGTQWVTNRPVMNFAGTAARGSAIPSPVEGMAAYLNDSNILSLYDGSAWKNSLATTGGILQVVSTTKTDATFSMASATFADITGLSATITPSSTSSKILIFYTVNAGVSQDAAVATNILRNSTSIAIGDASGSRTRVNSKENNRTAGVPFSMGNQFLDAPATTSEITYKIQIATGAGTLFVNRESTNSNSAILQFAQAVSTITLMEVAG